MNTNRIVMGTALAMILSFGLYAKAQGPTYPIQKQAGQKREGGTAVDAFAKVSKQADKGLVEVSLWVRKSGQIGIGYGGVQVILLDKDGNTLHKTDWLMGTVGAVLGRGTSEKWFPGPTKEHTRDFEVPLAKLPDVRAVALVTGIRDTGILNTDELNNTLNGIINTARDEFNKKVQDAIRGGNPEDRKALRDGTILFLKVMAAQ